MIKTAAIADVDLFETLERNVDAILYQKDPRVLKDIVLRSAAIKAKVGLAFFLAQSPVNFVCRWLWRMPEKTGFDASSIMATP